MVKDPDEKFFERADGHIDLANSQLDDAGPGKVSASMMYATARFNIWLSASSFSSPEELRAEKKRTLAYFADEYRKMLEDNMDDYIENFEAYMEDGEDSGPA